MRIRIHALPLALLLIAAGCDSGIQSSPLIEDASTDLPFETNDAVVGCVEDEDCVDEDGDLCNGVPACVEGECVPNPETVIECPAAEAPCLRAVCVPDTGACVEALAEEGSACDDEDACTTGDACEGGRCVGEAICDCRQDADCVAADDGDLCNGTFACVAGTCEFDITTVIECPAPPGQCQSNQCAPQTGECVAAPAPNGAPCDDEDPCTAPDACQEGVCAPGAPQCGCASDEECAALDDGDLCNGVPICEGGECVEDPTSIVECPGSDDPCLAVFCMPATGECQSAAVANGARCEDGDFCTAPDTCQAGQCVSGPNDCACRSDLDCAAGDDEDLCNGRLSCQAGQCQLDPTTVVTCRPPLAPCLSARCEPSTGLCEETPEEGACEDGNPCTAPDACVEGRCQPGQDICGDCEGDADCAALDDEDLCNGGLICRNSECITNPASVVICPANADPCLLNICVPATGQCEATPNDGQPCQDGEPCTDPDVCQGGGCQAGAWICECQLDEDCAPVDLCEGAAICAAGSCAVDSSAAIQCEPGFACAAGACERDEDACFWGCDDENDCTEDACDLESNHCTNTPLSDTPCVIDACTDGALCAAGVCQGGQEITCVDQNPETDERCDLERGCLYPPFNDVCGGAVGFTLGAATGVVSTPLPVRDLSDGIALGCEEIARPELVYTLDLTERGGVTFNVPGVAPEAPPRFALYQGDCAAPVDERCLALNEGGVFDAGTYHLVVGLDPSTAEAIYSLDASWRPACEVLDCDDQNPCTDDSCDPGPGVCNHPPIPDTTPCAADLCFNEQTCFGGECQGGVAVECVDGEPLTQDLCEPSLGCRFPPINDACEGAIELSPDPTVVMSVDPREAAADYELSCGQGAPDVVYAFEIPGPRVMQVSGNQGSSIFSLREADCGAEIACAQGQLERALSPGRYSLIVSRDRHVDFELTLTDPCAALDCDDGEDCTDDGCDPDQVICVNTLRGDGEVCVSDNLCLVNQACAAGVCQGGEERVCVDENPQTEVACEPARGCVSTHLNERCVDAVTLDPVGTHHFEGDARAAVMDSPLGMDCGGDAPDIFYRFVLPAEELVRVDLEGAPGSAVAILSPDCEAVDAPRCVDERSSSVLTLPPGGHVLAVKTTGVFSLDLTFGCADEANHPAQLPFNEPLDLVSVSGDNDSFYLPLLCEGGLFVVNAVFDEGRSDIDLSLSAECDAGGCPVDPLALGEATPAGERLTWEVTAGDWDNVLTVGTAALNACNPYSLYAELFCPGDAEICIGDLDEDRDGFAACEDPDCSGEVVQEGECTGPEDLELFSQSVLVDASIFCSDECNADQVCIMTCLSNETGLSDGCVDCVNPLLNCVGDFCIQSCLFGTELECGLCISQNCLGALNDCTGVVCLPETACDDGVDNDVDALIDCNDPDCDEWCSQEHICDDNVDNDGDGPLDCADPDCAGIAPCP